MNILLFLGTGHTQAHRGTRFTLMLPTLVPLILSGWVRYAGAKWLGSDGFWLVFGGQAIMAAGYPFGLAVSAPLSETWFSAEGRALATAAGGLSPTVGTVIASIFAQSMFTGEDDLGGFEQWMLVIAVMNSVVVICAWIGLREAPPTPPSLVQHTC